MILVTGATGTVGRHLVLELKTRQVPFRVLTRDARKARARLGPVDAVEADLGRPETLTKALAGVDAAFLLSAVSPEIAANEGSFARAAKKAGVKRLVKLSGLGAAPRSPAALLRWHGEAEEVVLRSGVPSTLLRPAGFYQNLLGHADSIRRGTLVAPMGEARVAMIDARDVAAVAAAVLCGPARDGRTLTLTGPAALTYAEIAATLARALGRPVVYRAADPDDARRAMAASGVPAWMTDALLGLAERFRAGDADLVTDEVLSATGRPPTAFESFVRDHAAPLS